MFQEHTNFTGWDEVVGPVLLSMKHEPNVEQTRVLLRLKTGTQQTVIPSTNTPPITVAKVRRFDSMGLFALRA